MKCKYLWISVVVLVSVSCARPEKGPAIYLSGSASQLEALGAAELRRYLYLLTGKLAPVIKIGSLAELKDPGILVDQKGRFQTPGREHDASAGKIAAEQMLKLGPGDFQLKTFEHDKTRHLLIAGGDGPGLLYGVYAFVETLGIRFYLDGDVVPEERIRFKMPALDEIRRPLFKLRGIQPFHDFAEGPDWWNEENYKMILGQLPKLGMNFFGLHTYPEGGPNAEPTVWIGLPGDLDKDGQAHFSYPSSYQNTFRVNPGSHNWGYQAKKTSDFHFGASQLFERDDYGVDIMEGLMPEPKTPEQSNELFKRTAALFRDAFSFAKLLGVQTCVGTETPLTVPALVQERLRRMGKDPKDPGIIRELYKGIFQRIAVAYPVDYYWLWTNEGWTWSDASSEAIKAVMTDLDMAVRAAEDLGRPFSLATCGWVLGPPNNRTLFDQMLPKNVAASCINREVGKAPLDPNFSRIEGRSKWAIPWLEDDPSLTSPQLWVGRMRRDAVDAQRYGCDGLMGIHWRTRILSPNIGALAKAAWDQTWNTMPSHFTDMNGPVDGQYAAFPDKPIAGTGEEAIYRDIRDRVYGYHLAIPDGIYTVTLQFCEGEFDRKGARLFDILIQGDKVAEKVDIFERAGKHKALDLSFKNIQVNGGKMLIDFSDRVHYPSVAGIVIEGATGEGKKFIKKINCGGPAVLDYEADWPETPRHLPSRDFYDDWAQNQFGPAAAKEIAEIFAKMDGKLPIPVNWTNGPGGIVPEKRPWTEVQINFQFVDELAGLRPRIKGKSYGERFDYWLRNFEYMREIARFSCLWGDYNQVLEKVKSIDLEAEKAKAARESLLPVRVKMVGSLKAIFSALLAAVSNAGELGTIANWEQHLLPDSMEKPGDELKKLLGTDLPTEARLAKVYDGPARIIVPTIRTAMQVGEHSRLKVIILTTNPPQEAFFYWRELGQGDFKAVPLRKLARSIYTVDIPAMMIDIEYYLRARVGGQDILFPSTAPELNLTIVVIQKSQK